MSFVALIPCGPGSLELERTSDLVDALDVLEKGNCLGVVVLDDGARCGIELGGRSRVRVVPNPRVGRGWGWAGGLIAGELWAWNQIAREYPEAEAIVKFDADALLLRPIADQLGKILQDSTIGIAGSRIDETPYPPYKTTPPFADFRRKVRKLRAPLGLWRLPKPHLRLGFTRSHRWIRSLFDAAEQGGYQDGELVEGGSCVVSMRCVQRLQKAGILDRWEEFLDLAVSDDIILTMLPYVVGMRAADAPLFCTEPQCLRFSPEALLADPTVGVVHSTKDFQGRSEEDIRRVFREARERFSSQD